MTNFKITLTVLILAVFKQTAFATTWGAAYPYTQQIEGQNVVVKAFPYNPFSGSPMIGVTKVYRNKKLLYTLDRYYRQPIFTSNDGQYLIVIYTSFSPTFESITSSGVESLDVNEPAIEVFKNGKPFRTFSLKDVIAITKLANDGHSFYWDYRVDFEAFQEAKSECKTCKEIYGRKVLRTGDTSEIDLDEWEECKSQCDSASYKKAAIRISKKSMYIQNSALFVLTNQNIVVKLDFEDMTLQHLALNKVIPDISAFTPPTLKRKYKKIKYPDKFLLPELIDGKTIGQGLAELLNKRLTTRDIDSVAIQIYFHTLLINKEGKCELIYVSPSVRDDYKKNNMLFVGNNEKLKETIEVWVKQQTFKTTFIPKGFFKFTFSDFVYLN